MPHFHNGAIVPFRDAKDTIVKMGELIGRGSQGDVYEALDIREDRRVAVKHCYGPYASDRELFYEKVKLLAASKPPHPDLCWPIAVSPFTSGGSFLFSMPLLEGYRALTGVITGRDPMTEDQKAVLAYKIAKIFRSLHSQGFVLGDVSDRNIRYRIDPKTGEIHVKVIDVDSLSLGGRGSLGMNGSGKYRAPELLLPDPDRRDGRPGCPTKESELHAIACLVFRLFVRRHPLDGAYARSFRADDPEGFLEAYARNPRFIFDGTDNDPGPVVTAKWERLPRPMQLYFRVAFSQRCLRDKTQRIGLDELVKCLTLSYRVQDPSSD